jgi:hypothetical protein
MNYLPRLASSFDPLDCCLLSIRVTGVSHRHLATKCHIKRHGEGRESSGHAVGRGRVSTQLMFSHRWGTDMNYRFK